MVASGKELPPLGPIGEVPGYLTELITVVGEWRDSRVLPVLIAAPGAGMIITEPILRFGDTAVPLLIDAARHGRRNQLGGSLLALQWLTEGRDLLRPKGVNPSVLPTVAALALATNDPDLAQQVTLLAENPGIVSEVTGVIDAQTIERTQRGIAARLKMHQAK